MGEKGGFRSLLNDTWEQKFEISIDISDGDISGFEGTFVFNCHAEYCPNYFIVSQMLDRSLVLRTYQGIFIEFLFDDRGQQCMKREYISFLEFDMN